MFIRMHKIISSAFLSLAILPMAAHAKDKVPEAMKVPINSATTPTDTTDKRVQESPSGDNSVRNKIHDGNTAVSAEEQSNDKSDVEITRKIRQSIVKDKSLSTNAHNVKIITVKGSVVLKGPVANNDEKLKVEQSAAKVAGKEKVVSEIEVKK